MTCKECVHGDVCVHKRELNDFDVNYRCKCPDFINKADVAEVRHRKWLDNIEKTTTPSGITKDFAIGYKCSLCGRTEISKEPYCNCGAKMDLGDDAE